MSGTDGGAVTASPVSGDSSNTQPSSHITTSAGASVVTVGPTQMSNNMLTTRILIGLMTKH